MLNIQLRLDVEHFCFNELLYSILLICKLNLCSNETIIEYQTKKNAFETFENSPEFAERIKNAEEGYQKGDVVSHEEVMKNANARSWRTK